MRRSTDILRVQRKKMMHEKKFRHAESTNKGDGEKRTARYREYHKKKWCMRRRIDMLRLQRKEMMYEKKYRNAGNTNTGDGEKRRAR
jgi:hypothetical protein